MQKKSNNQSGLFTLRVVIACALVSLSALLAFVSFAAAPASGTIGTAGPSLAWTGTAAGVPPTAGGEADCVEGTNCDSFTMTISGTPADWAAAAKQLHVQITWTLNATDYDLFIHKGNLAGPVVASSASGGTTVEQVDLNPASSSIGTGAFVVHVVYFASAGSTDQYKGAASVIATPPGPVPAPAPASGLPPRYENFTPPAAGPATLGRSSGEPSIGVALPIAGHPEGRAMFQSDVQTLRVTFNGCAKPTWENKPAPTSQQDFDPILYTDPETGRTIVHLLTFAANPVVGESSVTDTASPANDGDVWTPSKGSGIGSGVDHQTVGGGRYHAPLPSQKPTGYPNAVYYCSQALVDASCARSDDGGINYGPSTITYTDECGGLHGHVKVGPDGTVYLPNKGCGTAQGAVVSEDNGTTWQIRTVPGSGSAGSDPSVGIDKNNRVYFGYSDGDTKAVVTTSDDRGKTWRRPLDVGASFGINNVVFPAVIAGDKDRAAFAFLGTPTAGGLQGAKFPGVWHLYIATTYDGGATWTTVDATPNDPVQRGCVWLGGGANVCRNMLDFMDAQMDQEGRVVVGYADGCAGGECAQARSSSTGNSYTALAAIARQSGGRRLLAKFDTDPSAGTAAPGMPFLTGKRNGGVTRLQWSLADNGGSTITRYDILRGTATGNETLLASVDGGTLGYDDATATAQATYFYKVVAVNAKGSSCGNNEISVTDAGSSITGNGFRVALDPTADGAAAANPDLDIQSLSIAEPTTGANAGKLVFNLKMTDLSVIPNNRRWRIIWNSQSSPGSQYYVGMTKDASGTVTFDYGTVATATVGLVLGVPSTTRVGNPDSGTFVASGANNGLITIVVSRDKVGGPQPGDLLGAISVRTYNTNQTTQVRSTDAIDTTSNAAAHDSTANAFTYALFEATPAPVPTPSPTPAPPKLSQLLNISTRARVQTGDNVAIAGFFIVGTEPKKVIIRGIGPSLGSTPPGALQDPTLELYDDKNVSFAFNDNWKDTQENEINTTGLPPKDDRESAIVATLNPGRYTAILRGKNNTSGIGLIEAYDLNQATLSNLANISTRGFVDTGDRVIIGGFIVGPETTTSTGVLVRAIGPSLASAGVPGSLQDPTMVLYNANGATIASNDNWKDSQQAAIEKTGIPPKDDRESAILTTLVPGQYTAIVQGKGGTTGVGLVEVYNLGVL